MWHNLLFAKSLFECILVFNLWVILSVKFTLKGFLLFQVKLMHLQICRCTPSSVTADKICVSLMLTWPLYNKTMQLSLTTWKSVKDWALILVLNHNREIALLLTTSSLHWTFFTINTSVHMAKRSLEIYSVLNKVCLNWLSVDSYCSHVLHV